MDDAAGLDGAAGGDDATGLDAAVDGAGLDDGEVDDATGRLDVGEPGDAGGLDDAPGDGVAEAGTMPRTMAAMPLKLTSRPVAVTSVAGRARLNRMTPRRLTP